MGFAGLAANYFSDIRLKDNIRHIGKRGGHNWYAWTWKPEAHELGLAGDDEGVLAHEVYETHPGAVTTNHGLLLVDYSKLEMNYGH